MLGVWAGMMLFLVPIWVAFAIGILVGWFWKPQWASKGTEKLSCSVSKASASSSYSSSSWTADYGKDKGQLSVSPAEYEDCRYLGIIGPLSLSLVIILLPFGFLRLSLVVQVIRILILHQIFFLILDGINHVHWIRKVIPITDSEQFISS